MKDDCADETGMITKTYDECEECDEYPCRELVRALNEIIEGRN